MKKAVVLSMLIGFFALDGFAIQVAPTYQLFTVKPGGKTEGRCTVTNNEENDLTISLSSKDWFVAPGNEKFKAPDWLTFKTKEFDLKKGASQEVEFIVKAPKGAQGELVGMLSFNLKEDIPTNINKVLSVAIYNAIEGSEKVKGNIKAIMVSPTTGTVNVSVLLENKGNVHLRPNGFFEMKNEKDQTVANIFLEQGRPTYPGKEGVYVGKLDDIRLKPGFYKCFITMTDIDRQIEIVKISKKIEILENYSVEMR